MAYASPSRGSRGGSSYSRGGGGGGGGSTNAVAYAFAVIIVVGVVVLVIAMSGGKKPAPPQPKAPVAVPVPVVTKPVGPKEKPYPPMPAAKIDEARKLVATFDRDSAEGERLYNESLQAKKAGLDAEWQSKLKEARRLLEDIRDKWNDFMATLPHNSDYDEEQVTAHYFPRENGRVASLTKKLAAMKSDER